MDKGELIKRSFTTVCKCKAVLYKTIATAVKRGAKTLEEIQRKTRANTGCGKTCTNKILEIIKEHSK